MSARNKEILSGAVVCGMMMPLFISGFVGVAIGAVVGALLTAQGTEITE